MRLSVVCGQAEIEKLAILAYKRITSLRKETTGTDQGSKGRADDQNNQGTKGVNARVPWTREVNKLVMECYLRNEPSRRGCSKRMLNIWRNDIGVFECSEQRLADQMRAIIVNWLDLEMEEPRRKIDRSGASNEQMTDVTRENRADITDHYSSLQPEFEDAQVRMKTGLPNLSDQKCIWMDWTSTSIWHLKYWNNLNRGVIQNHTTYVD